MAVMETKIIQVKNDPRTINETNEAWGRWGWSVLSIQVTHTQNTKTYTSDWQRLTGSNEATVETTTINYATITYQRDKGIPNYERLVELEQEYGAVEAKVRARFEARREELKNTQVSDAVKFEFGTKHVFIAIGLLWCYIIPGVIYIAYKYNQYKKSKTAENQLLLQKGAAEQAELDSRWRELNEEQSRMINDEKARLLSEAAQILRAA